MKCVKMIMKLKLRNNTPHDRAVL